MKSIRLACAVSVFAAASITMAHAASTLAVQVPYPFVAEGVSLPAGAYIIHEMQPSGAVLLRGPNGRAVMVMSQPGAVIAPGAPAELVFRNVNGRMVLAAVHEATDGARVIPAAVK